MRAAVRLSALRLGGSVLPRGAALTAPMVPATSSGLLDNGQIDLGHFKQSWCGGYPQLARCRLCAASDNTTAGSVDAPEPGCRDPSPGYAASARQRPDVGCQKGSLLRPAKFDR